MKRNESLLRFLRKIGIVTEAPDPSEINGIGPIAYLAKQGLINEKETIITLARYLGIEYIDLEDPAQVSTFAVSEFTSLLDGDFCLERIVVPLKRTRNSVVVAFANPFDHETQKDLEFQLSSPVKIVIAEESKIKRLINNHFLCNTTSSDSTIADEYIDIELIKGGSEDDGENHSQHNVAPIVKLVNEILLDAIKAEASDIHVEPAKNVVDIRFRIDGVMQKVLEVPKKLQSYLIARIKILSGMDVSEKRRPQDGRLGVRYGNKTIDMRVSTVPTSFGEKIVLRIMRSDYSNITFESLGVPPDIQSKLENILLSRSKILLVTGPTGSGKTTTLYTAINSIKDGKTNITTVEDPIEYKFEGINQIQLNKAIDVTFASALRSILRQDPDVIMIGEIRDHETLTIALQAALTGHLVLSTLHTNDAPNAITRMLNMGADRFVLASSLAGILAQRLVRKLCKHCRIKLSDRELEEHEKYISAYGLDPSSLYKPVGCGHCFQTGYKGRIGIYSFLEVTEQISRLITESAPLDDIIVVASENGYTPLDLAVAELLNRGETSFEEARGYLSTVANRAPLKSEPLNTSAFTSSTTHVAHKDCAKDRAKIKKKKILVVDDSKQVRKLIRAILEKEMFQVAEAENGQNGLEKVFEETPDVILCDLSMPVMNGKEFLSKIKSNVATKHIPVVMLTGDASEENEISLIEAGAHDFMSKKTSPDVIVSRVKRVLQLAEQG